MRLLVFGLSGQIGVALQPLLDGQHSAVAISRSVHANAPQIEWRRGHVDALPITDSDRFDAIVSLGPLDHFARWFAQTNVSVGRIVAMGSTSVHVKHHSPDPAERDVAARLARAEQQLFAAGAARGLPCFLLRPTLVWGNGRDRSLSRVAALARRWPLVPIPADARGLRQPVHVQDLAKATLAALAAPPTAAGAFDLPGGETMTVTEMLRRTVNAVPGGRAVSVPNRLFRAGVALAGLGQAGLLSRLQDDLVFDPAPAQAALSWQPRGFAPTAAELGV